MQGNLTIFSLVFDFAYLRVTIFFVSNKNAHPSTPHVIIYISFNGHSISPLHFSIYHFPYLKVKYNRSVS